MEKKVIKEIKATKENNLNDKPNVTNKKTQKSGRRRTKYTILCDTTEDYVSDSSSILTSNQAMKTGEALRINPWGKPIAVNEEPENEKVSKKSSVESIIPTADKQKSKFLIRTNGC